MKKVLSLLVAFIFLQVQTWALSGGPVYGGSTKAVQGTYAGSLLPSVAGNSLGIFALGVPGDGLASGIFAMFFQGGSYYGSIVGVIDPDLLTLNALANAQENEIETLFVSTTGTVVNIIVPVALASGVINATLSPPAQGNFGSTGGYRVDGTGSLATFVFDPVTGAPVANGTITVTVVGFQQSATVDGTLNLNTLTGTQANGTGSSGS